MRIHCSEPRSWYRSKNVSFSWISCAAENYRLDLVAMNHGHVLATLALTVALICFADSPKLSGVGGAMQEMVAKNEIAGAVTVVVTRDKLLHLETTGFADGAATRPMTPETR